MYEILIVDDEPVFRESLATYFPWEKTGFHVCGRASDGQEALNFLSRHHVHVVLTDISMPNINGIELAEQIRKTDPQIYIVFLTAYSDFSYAQQAIRYGVRFYILKPSDFNEIEATFQQIRNELDDRQRQNSGNGRKAKDQEILDAVHQYINTHYRDATLGELSSNLYLSESYLSQLIRLRLGRTFSDLLQEERMKQAGRRLLEPGAKIYEIAEAVGYSNPNNFTRAFRNYYHLSPRQYQVVHGAEVS